MLLMLFFIALFVTATKAKLDALSESHDPNIIECLHIILRNIFQENVNTLTLLKYAKKDNFPVILPCARINDNIESIQNWPKSLFRAYLLRGEMAEFKNVMQRLFEHKILWPKSWYILFANFNDNSSFSFFTKYYIANVFAIKAENLDIYTIDPYKYENVNFPENHPYKIGSCSNISEISFPQYFSKYPLKWRNTTVYEHLRVQEPFTTTSHDGLEDNLFDLFKERLGFKNNRKNVSKGKTTSQIIQDDIECKQKVRENKIDIFGGLLTLKTEDDPMDYQLLPAYMFKALVWMTPNGLSISEAWRIAHIFSYDFYLGWILILFIVSILAKGFFKINIQLILGTAFQILLEYPVIDKLRLKSLPTHLAVGAWILTMLIISAVFKNYLVVITATSVRKNQLETLDEILHSSLKLAGSKSIYMRELYSTQKPGELQVNFDKMISCKVSEECLNRTAFKKDVATLVEKTMAEYYYIPNWYRDENGDSMVHLGSEIVLTETVQMIFSKGYPLFRGCANIILQANDNGWFENQQDSLARATETKMIKIDNETKSVTLSYIAFTFYIWTCGVTLAFITFCLEIILSNVIKRLLKK